MGKVLDLSKSVYEICASDPMAKSILLNVGFKTASNPKSIGAMRNKTLDQIVPIRGVGFEELMKIFEEKGYTITGLDD